MSVSSSESDNPFGVLFREDDINTTFDHSFAIPPMANEEKKDKKDWSKALITLEGIAQENGQVSERTGFTLWDAADVLAQYMVHEGLSHFKNKRVIELGTGLGLCGILATHLMPRRVILTDGDDRVLEKTRSNCVLNSVDKTCQVKKTS